MPTIVPADLPDSGDVGARMPRLWGFLPRPTPISWNFSEIVNDTRPLTDLVTASTTNMRACNMVIDEVADALNRYVGEEKPPDDLVKLWQAATKAGCTWALQNAFGQLLVQGATKHGSHIIRATPFHIGIAKTTIKGSSRHSDTKPMRVIMLTGKLLQFLSDLSSDDNINHIVKLQKLVFKEAFRFVFVPAGGLSLSWSELSV